MKNATGNKVYSFRQDGVPLSYLEARRGERKEKEKRMRWRRTNEGSLSRSPGWRRGMNASFSPSSSKTKLALARVFRAYSAPRRERTQNTKKATVLFNAFIATLSLVHFSPLALPLSCGLSAHGVVVSRCWGGGWHCGRGTRLAASAGWCLTPASALRQRVMGPRFKDTPEAGDSCWTGGSGGCVTVAEKCRAPRTLLGDARGPCGAAVK